MTDLVIDLDHELEVLNAFADQEMKEVAEYLKITELDLTFEWKENINGKRTNRGWVDHVLTAFVDGEEVGYVKVTYIPKNLYREYYSSIWEYMTNLVGWSVDRGRFNGPYQQLTGKNRRLSDIEKMNLMRRFMRYRDLEVLEVGPITKEQKRLIGVASGQLGEEYGPKFRRFSMYHRNRPFVANVRVEKE